MRSKHRFSLSFLAAATAALLPLLAFAADAESRAPRVITTSRAIEWQPADPAATLLSVQRPDGEVITETFAAGWNPMLRLEGLADGLYTYELRISQTDAGPRVQTGSFTVANGAIVPPGVVERATAARRPALPVVPNTLFPDDVSAQGGVCAGSDCTASEVYGFASAKLKENNTRLKFEDTSTSAGFASTDWQLSANDTFSGGANKFFVEDLTAATVPFLIEGATPNNTLYLDSTGRIGLGVVSPLFQIHHSSGARLDAGNWVNASSRALKQDIHPLDRNAAFDALNALQPVTFAYKANPAETNVGFIAEDVPDLVATTDRKGLSSMDVVAVLTKVIQEQQHTIDDLQTRLERLEQKEN